MIESCDFFARRFCMVTREINRYFSAFCISNRGLSYLNPNWATNCAFYDFATSMLYLLITFQSGDLRQFMLNLSLLIADAGK